MSKAEEMKELGIKDDNLYRAFVLNAGKPVTKIKLADLKRLSWDEYMAEDDPESWDPVYDLSGIEYCTNLEGLGFDGNGVSDLTPLQDLIHLKELWLVDNDVNSVAMLTNLKNLEKLVLDMCRPLKDISPICSLPHLNYLNIGTTRVTDITPLENLPMLKELSLYNMKELDLEKGSDNYEVLIRLIMKGVKIGIRGIGELEKEATSRMKNRITAKGELTLLDFLKVHNGFKLAQLIEEKGITGTYTQGYGKDNENNSVLHLALEAYFAGYKDELTDQKAVVARLIKEGAPLNHHNAWGSTPFIYYLKNNKKADPEIVEMLVQAGAHINTRNESREAALTNAINAEQTEIVLYLLKHNAEVLPNDFNFLCAKGMKEAASIVLERGFKIDQALKDPLSDAVMNEQYEIIELLLANGCDIHFKNKYGNTALFNVKTKKMTDYLISFGLDVHTIDYNGENALFPAARFCYTEAVKALIGHGAAVIINDKGQTPVHKANYYSYAKEMYEEQLKLLLHHGMEINQVDEDGCTILDLMKHEEGKSLLRSFGAKTRKELKIDFGELNK